MTVLFRKITATTMPGMRLAEWNAMALKSALLKKLAGSFPPNALVQFKWKGLDVAVRTDPVGKPWQFFLGRLDPNGRVRGERYVRTLKTDERGNVIKDHWDLKGRAS